MDAVLFGGHFDVVLDFVGIGFAVFVRVVLVVNVRPGGANARLAPFAVFLERITGLFVRLKAGVGIARRRVAAVLAFRLFVGHCSFLSVCPLGRQQQCSRVCAVLWRAGAQSPRFNRTLCAATSR